MKDSNLKNHASLFSETAIDSGFSLLDGSFSLADHFVVCLNLGLLGGRVEDIGLKFLDLLL
jgi:hypothetical protein